MGNIEILKKKVFNTRGAHFQVALNKQVFIFLFTVEYRRLCCWVPVYYVWNGPSRSFDILPSTTLLLLLIWISFQNLLLLLLLWFRLGFFFSLSFFLSGDGGKRGNPDTGDGRREGEDVASEFDNQMPALFRRKRSPFCIGKKGQLFFFFKMPTVYTHESSARMRFRTSPNQQVQYWTRY